MYKIGSGQKFDLDYYINTHMKMVGSLFGPAGMRSAQVLRGIGSPTGEPPSIDVIALLDFDTIEAFKAAAYAHGAAIFGDIPNFTNVQPSIQFNDRLQ
jgi:uncharacterized protein (TIGR02118 family)